MQSRESRESGGPKAAREAGGEATATEPAPRTLRILLVDQEAALLRSLCGLFRQHSVFCAETIEQAVTILEAQAVDVVVSDHVMSGGRGREVLHLAARLQPRASRVLHSNEPPGDLGVLLDSALVHHFFVKPSTGELKHLFDSLEGLSLIPSR